MFIHKKKKRSFKKQKRVTRMNFFSYYIIWCHVNIVDDPILATIKLPIVINHNKLSQYCARFARLFTKCEHLGRKIHDPLLNVITFNVWRGCNDRENFHRYREIPRGKAYVEPLRASRVTSLLDSFDSFLSCALISLSLSRTFFFY